MFALARLKLYAYAAVAVLGAVIMVYLKGVASGAQKVRMKATQRRLDDIIDAKDVENEVKSLDDDALLDRANKWVRKRDG
ncbi:MAG: hypothetical protein ACPG4F_04565 [Paracoccaceae bacterium]